jgi:hypothetical protein
MWIERKLVGTLLDNSVDSNEMRGSTSLGGCRTSPFLKATRSMPTAPCVKLISMTDTLVRAKIPYLVHYHVPRGRKVRLTRVWEDTPLSLRAPTQAEAPVAYRVARTDPKDDTQPDYDIRHFDGKLWWPVLDSQNARRAAENFLNGLAGGDYFSLGILHPSMAPYWSSSKPTLDEAFRDVKVREVVRTTRDEQLALAQRGVSETMICDGALYVLAGEPMYFGFPSELPGDREISLEVGASPWRGFLGYGSRVPGPPGDERRHALFDADVFDVRNLDEDMTLLEQRGFKIRLASRVEILRDLPVAESALGICAGAALSRLFMEEPIAAAFSDRVTGRSHPTAVPSLVPVEICRAVLRDIVELYPPESQDRSLRDAIFCAQNVLKRLGAEPAPSLTDEDEEALSSLR